MKSSEKQADDDGTEELTKFELWLSRKYGDDFLKKVFPVIMTVVVILTFALSLVVFKGVPVAFANLMINNRVVSENSRALAEGVVRASLIVGYMFCISLMPSIKTVFMYHGAEHKTIACYESRQELTVENIALQSRFHPRCGTSFIVLVLLVGIIAGFFLPSRNMWVRFGLQLLLLIPEASIVYEIIKIAGRYDNLFVRCVSAPGIWLQHITTKEPTEKQIEVAIAALNPCIPQNPNEDKW
jgi:uncharacterized protein YqhQ